MRKALIILALAFMVSAVGAQSSQNQSPELSQCTVLDVSNTELSDGSSIQQEDVLRPDDEVSVADNGSLIMVCNDGFREIQSGEAGLVSEVAVRTDEFNTDIPRNQSEQSIEEALQDTEQIEENLDQVNKVVDDTVPDRIASIILGDNVNMQVDNTTIGIATNSSGVTGVEEGGFEDPDLAISMDGQSIERIMTSENTAEEFREAYHGDGIEVEAYTWRNKISLGVVNTASRVYGFITRFR